MRKSFSKIFNRRKAKKRKQQRAASLEYQQETPPTADVKKPSSDRVLRRPTAESAVESAALEPPAKTTTQKAIEKPAGFTPVHRPLPKHLPPTMLESIDSPVVVNAYEDIPVLEDTKLPRGGVSVETKAVGRVQVRVSIWQMTRVILFVYSH